MKLEFSNDDFQTKLMLLYMLEQIEIPLTEQFILDICTTRNDWINYMECVSVFHDLLRDGFIYTPDTQDIKRCRYTLTAKGRSGLSIYYEEVPENIRQEISEFSKTNRMYFKRLQEYVADFKKNSDGTYKVTLRIIETSCSEPMFEIKIDLQTRADAVRAVEIWTTKAPSFYEFVYTNLIN
ncbi:MAG: DUF4364 family protein [Clostridia bacterium]|nr:DUF4364 family protein [Clostridia bacterium]